MSSYEKYRLLDVIWVFTRDYTTSRYTLPKVCKEILRMLSDMGYNAELLPGTRDSKIIQVDREQQFRIIRVKDWNQFDVLLVN